MALVLVTMSARETRALGASVGRLLRAGDILCLNGDLGSGKTTFTQGLAQGLDIPNDVVVNSPTFTILAEHSEGRIPLYHFDVYRLSGPRDVYDLAFDEYLDGSGVVVIEWADRIREALPDDTLMIAFSHDPSSNPLPDEVDIDGDVEASLAGARAIEFRSTGPRSGAIMAKLEASQ